MEIKQIDFEKGEVIGKSGTVYKISNSITAGRWAEFRAQEHLFYFGMTARDTFHRIKDVLTSFDKQINIGKAIHELYNIADRMASIADRKPDTIFYLVACFLNSDDEDISTYNIDEIERKIADWKEYDVMGQNGFFHLAASLSPHFIEDYNEIFQTISQKMEEKREKSK